MGPHSDTCRLRSLDLEIDESFSINFYPNPGRVRNLVEVRQQLEKQLLHTVS